MRRGSRPLQRLSGCPTTTEQDVAPPSLTPVSALPGSAEVRPVRPGPLRVRLRPRRRARLPPPDGPLQGDGAAPGEAPERRVPGARLPFPATVARHLPAAGVYSSGQACSPHPMLPLPSLNEEEEGTHVIICRSSQVLLLCLPFRGRAMMLLYSLSASFPAAATAGLGRGQEEERLVDLRPRPRGMARRRHRTACPPPPST